MIHIRIYYIYIYAFRKWRFILIRGGGGVRLIRGILTRGISARGILTHGILARGFLAHDAPRITDGG